MAARAQAKKPKVKAGAPASFARRPLRTIKPGEAADEYTHPRQQLARLERNGALHRVANGYYIVTPQDQVGLRWTPALEAVAAGIGSADFGPRHAILMGISAARVHGAIPRGLSVAVVAVPKQRLRVHLRDRKGQVLFVKRATDRLDAEALTTELGRALVTTVEQTVLDLAHRPTLGDAEVDVPTAIRTLLPRCDQGRMTMIASEQRLRSAHQRALVLGQARA